MKLKVQNGPFTHKGVGGAASFKPSGEPVVYGRNPAKFQVWGVADNAARMFVGFNVGHEPTWDVDYLAKTFRSVRSKQKNDAGKPIPPDSSFVLQNGFYTANDGSLVYENSVQVIVLSIFGESLGKFSENMIDVAGHIAHELKQETVILEIQTKGVPVEVFGVSWQD